MWSTIKAYATPLFNTMSDEELLKYAYKNGMIDLSSIQQDIMKKKEKELLEKHPYKVWQSTDGKWHTYFPDEKCGRVRKNRSTLEEINKLIIEHYRVREVNPTFNQLFREWNDRKLDLNKISEATHFRNIQIYERHFDEFGLKRIKSTREIEITDFLEKQIAKHQLSSKGFSNLKSIMKGILKRAKRMGYIEYSVDVLLSDMDVTERQFRKVKNTQSHQIFDDEEYDLIMNYLKENLDQYNAVIMLMFLTGMRVGEAVVLKNSDILTDLSISITKTETRYKDKDGKYKTFVKDCPKTDAGIRTVVLPREYDWFGQKLRTLNPDGEFIFIRKNGKRMQTADARRRLYKVCDWIDINRKSPHCIRKTYGTILLDNNVPEKVVERQMGHTTIATTRMYYYKDRTKIDDKIDIISKLEVFQR